MLEWATAVLPRRRLPLFRPASSRLSFPISLSAYQSTLSAVSGSTLAARCAGI